MGKRYDNAVNRVLKQIEANRVLTAYNALAHEDTTVGPYKQAVDTGMRFAVVGVRGNRCQTEHRTGKHAAQEFVERVGEGRAREAAIESEKRHGDILSSLAFDDPQP